jgi:hypothetical protein
MIPTHQRAEAPRGDAAHRARAGQEDAPALKGVRRRVRVGLGRSVVGPQERPAPWPVGASAATPLYGCPRAARVWPRVCVHTKRHRGVTREHTPLRCNALRPRDARRDGFGTTYKAEVGGSRPSTPTAQPQVRRPAPHCYLAADRGGTQPQGGARPGRALERRLHPAAVRHPLPSLMKNLNRHTVRSTHASPR